ncbi:OmpA family protein [Methylomonas methanica]|jgi:outer membrane protein OmpA-like peptidoglycan-associated protein|uniref:OmpA family protein n=1 Tax=Methylomonas methanica TaxID=421 RepID=UPI0009EF656E|nr:OmpA family protein [Methylomonas methanica]
MTKKRLAIFALLSTCANVGNSQTFHVEPITANVVAEDAYGTPQSNTVTVLFDNRSVIFRPNFSDSTILDGAQNAALITVRGRTSTPIPSVKDEQLALSRALSARKYLIERGVSPLKIHVNYASGSDFIADNSTPEGKRQNQRVEIELVYVTPTSSYSSVPQL